MLPFLKKRPNVVFVECDSMDGRAWGAMAFPPLMRGSRAMDALAMGGAVFENAYSNNPICCCSRASMLSGQYTFHCHGWNNYKGLPHSQPTIFSEFEKAGYDMGIFGKTDYVSGDHTQRARVTAWLRTTDLHLPEYNMGKPEIMEGGEKRVHQKDWANLDRSLEWLNRRAGTEKPFFFYLGLNLPHPEFVTSRYYLDMVDQDAIEIPPRDTCSHPVMECQQRRKAWRHGLDDESVKKTRGIYYGMIAETDAILGELKNRLEELKLEGDTYFIFTSDHGEMNMEHGQFYKSNMYEPAVRVPLVFSGPGIKKGRRISRPVSLIDLFPTLESLAGIHSGLPLDGISLAPELLGIGEGSSPPVFSEYHDGSLNASTSMIREGDWKLVAFSGGYEPLLFNLKEDPWEIRSLASILPEKTAAMKETLCRISNLDRVAAQVKEYDQDCFRVWRDEQKGAGTYEKTMARIYSGWDYPEELETLPWTGENEEKIAAWLEETPSGSTALI